LAPAHKNFWLRPCLPNGEGKATQNGLLMETKLQACRMEF
jgi:hypothetical protein